MPTYAPTPGDRIKDLFRNTKEDVAIIAPFIKTGALESLLDVIPADVHMRCVTRWLPREVGAGVSDPEILDVLEERSNFTLSLVDNLHAKLYISGRKCLAGSANVTISALGTAARETNIEVLVETTIDDPGVSSTLSEISKLERPANRVLAEAARKLGDNFSLPINADGDKVFWFPKSRNPQFAYQLYSQLPKGFLGRANEILLQDLAASNLPPGLSECELEAQVRTLLCQIPLAEALLNSTEDIRLTRSDALSHLKSFTDKEFTTYDLWSAFINWMTYFFPNEVMQQQITEIALRRARKLQ